jgi:hypothetical protein
LTIQRLGITSLPDPQEHHFSFADHQSIKILIHTYSPFFMFVRDTYSLSVPRFPSIVSELLLPIKLISSDKIYLGEVLFI